MLHTARFRVLSRHESRPRAQFAHPKHERVPGQDIGIFGGWRREGLANGVSARLNSGRFKLVSAGLRSRTVMQGAGEIDCNIASRRPRVGYCGTEFGGWGLGGATSQRAASSQRPASSRLAFRSIRARIQPAATRLVSIQGCLPASFLAQCKPGRRWMSRVGRIIWAGGR